MQLLPPPKPTPIDLKLKLGHLCICDRHKWFLGFPLALVQFIALGEVAVGGSVTHSDAL